MIVIVKCGEWAVRLAVYYPFGQGSSAHPGTMNAGADRRRETH